MTVRTPSCDREPWPSVTTSQRLRPTNGLIGLCTPGDLNPAPLYDAGFRIAGLEVPVGVGVATVVIDALLVHRDSSHLVACESKSGANIGREQGGKYALLDAQDVRLAANVDLPTRTPPTVETLYVCLDQHASRIRQGLAAANLPFPVLSIASAAVRLLDRHYASQRLSDALPAPAYPLPAGVARYLYLDEQSTEVELRSVARAELATLQSRRLPGQSIPGLVEAAIPHFFLYGQAGRGEMIRRFSRVVQTLAKEESDTFVFQPPSASSNEARVQVLGTPEDKDPRGRTQAWQATGRVRQTPRKSVDPDQMDLLRELEVTDDVDENIEDSDGEALA